MIAAQSQTRQKQSQTKQKQRSRASALPQGLLLCALLLLAACAGAPPEPKTPPVPQRDRVAELRTAAAASAASVELEPLQSAAVDVLRAEATKLEVAGKFAEAEKRIDTALTIEPQNPHLWQLKAEARLRAKQYLDAEKLAMKSFDMGARIGRWCTRNWLLIAESRDALGALPSSQAARKRAEGCPVGPLIRY